MDNYNLPIGGDIGPLLNNLNAARTALTATNDAAIQTGATIRDNFTQAGAAIDQTNRSINQAATTYNTAKNSIAQLTDALKAYKDLAFSEQDISKLKAYNKNIQDIERELQRLGSVGKKAYSDQTGQIERLNTAVKLYTEFINKATNTDQIVKYNKKLEETQAQITKLSNAGKKGFDDLGNSIKQNSENSSGFLSNLKAIGAAIGITFGLQQIVSWGKELFRIANEASGVERAFARLGRPDLLPKLRAETRGFISDLDLERLTVRANNFNIPIDKLGTLLLFASERAKDTGESVDKLTEDIISGLGRKSTRIIDNLGISAIAVQQEFKKTGDFTIAVTNIIEREMGKSGIAVDTLADRTNKASTKFKNFFKGIATDFFALFNQDIPDNTVIEKLTARALASQKNFNDKSSIERTKSIESQKIQIAQLSETLKMAQKLTSGYGKTVSIGGEVFKLNTSQEVDLAKKAAGERLVAAQNVLRILSKQNTELEKTERFSKDIVSLDEKRAQVSDLVGQANSIIPKSQADTDRRKKLLKDAKDIQDEIDEIVGKNEKKREKQDNTAEAKRLARQKQVGDQEIALQNQITEALGQVSEDKTKLEIDRENARYNIALNNLKKQKADFPELQKLINQAIEAENVSHAAKLAGITKKQEQEQIAIRSSSQREISKILGDDREEQINDINAKYDLIRQNAKKAGLLTKDVEVKLADAQAKAVRYVTITSLQENNKIAEDLEIANIQNRKKLAGETEKRYELETQKDILEIKIKYAEEALKLIENDPSKALDVANLRLKISGLKKDLTGVFKDIANDKTFTIGGLFKKLLGADDDTFKQISSAVDAYKQLFSGIADSISESYQREIEAGNERVDALKDQLDTAQSYLDEQNDLKKDGYANDAAAAQKNVDAIKGTLQQEEAARQENIKQQQDAQKIAAEIRAVEIAANTVEQVSNLATAASKIFKAHAGIPFAGVVIALGAIAAMVAGFLAIKASIKSATSDNVTKFKTGGKIGGRAHEDGGNKYQSIDGNDTRFIEIERDEYIINKKSTSKHEKLIDAINRDDFSSLSINDISLKQLLQGTGVTDNSSIARSLGRETNDKQDAAGPTVVFVQSAQDPNTAKMSDNIEKLVKIEEEKPVIVDYGDHVEITYKTKSGIRKEKIWKKK